ncbi:hypothetical protein IAG25_34915 [Caballeronia sp. EK]|uniref:hypothetical protein n=1 Tax=Caballeronia sp. EK TaxID=2767469 RepID=UPI0016566CCC|nr:hypothetical protein [Caballeronia sp. EK]MBC8642015.1 hypothetical protein [Caballeronia sp. EK]
MAAASKLTVAPVGTCRIHGPLRKGVSRYPIKANTWRNYGFVHTSAEALQQVRFMFGSQSIPAMIQPLTFRPGTSLQSLEKPYVPADVYLVELSSRKLLSVGEHAVQTNYMGRYFGEFLADRDRARLFWSMGAAEQHAVRRAWLDTDPVFLRLSKDDRELLASISRRVQSDNEIERDMAQIVQVVGRDKLVFVTHVDAVTPDESVIAQRHELIELVKACAARLDVPCYDPTPAMQEIGQNHALERNGLDLTHYTDAFAERLFDDWYARYLVRRVGILSWNRFEVSDPVAAIEATWFAGDLRGASRRLHAALRADPTQGEHRMLLARMQSDLGDHEGAIANAEAALSEDGPTEQANELLMRSLFELERYVEAHRIATGLLGDERETPEVLRICALSAARIGEFETAIVSWKRLFRLTRESSEAADAVLDLLEAADDAQAAESWADEVREVLPTHGPSFAVQWRRWISSGNRTALFALAAQAPPLDVGLVLPLARLSATKGFVVAAARLIEAQGAIIKDNPEVVGWIAVQAPKWLSEAKDAIEHNDLHVAVDRIGGNCLLDPESRPIMRAEWTLEKRLQKDARAAFSEKNHVWLIELIDHVVEAGLSFPEMHSYRGRAAEAIGDMNAAIHFLRNAADERGASLSSRLYLARVAARRNFYAEALEAFGQIASNENVDQAMRNEALRQLDTVRSRCVRAARELNARGGHDKAWALLDLIEGDVDVTSERKRVLSALHVKLRLLDLSDASGRSARAKAILDLAPRDHLALKAAAVAAMRLQRFSEALPYWEALRGTPERADYVESNIKKCARLIERSTVSTGFPRKVAC